MNLLFWLWTIAVVVLTPLARGGSVQTIDNRVYEGKVRLTQGGVILVETSGGVQKVSPDNLKFAQFGLLPAGTILPRGWQREGIGNTQGSCIEKEGRFVLRATAGITPLQDTKTRRSAEYVHRVLRGDGDFAARLESVSGPSDSGTAGIMLRESLESTSAFVLLGVTPEHKLRLELRESGWGQVSRKEFGQVSLPLWLKMRRDENTVTSWRSTDGKSWEKIETCKLNVAREQFPDGGEWKLKGLAGMAIANPVSNLVCSAAFTHASLTAYGLLGVYYADPNFKQFRFSRPDPKLAFRWGYKSPALAFPDENFSVRWTGNIELKTPGRCVFSYEYEGAAKLWLDGKELIPAPTKEKEKKNKRKTQEVFLNAGQKYPFQVDYQAGEGAALILLTCTREQKGEVPLEKAFTYSYDQNSPEEYSDSQPNPFTAKGVWLRNGTFLAGELRAIDDTTTRVRFYGTNELAILNSKIARINFRRLSRPIDLHRTRNQSGLSFRNGDFFESDLCSLKDRVLMVSSVLFGRKTYNVENSEVSSFVLNDFAPLSARFEVKLADGSLIQATALNLKGEEVAIEDSSLGELVAHPNSLVEIRRPPAGLRAELK